MPMLIKQGWKNWEQKRKDKSDETKENSQTFKTVYFCERESESPEDDVRKRAECPSVKPSTFAVSALIGSVISRASAVIFNHITFYFNSKI